MGLLASTPPIYSLQYDVKLSEGLSCGGAYLKFLTAEDAFTPTGLKDDTPYTVMFGPDKCGATNKVRALRQCVGRNAAQCWVEAGRSRQGGCMAYAEVTIKTVCKSVCEGERWWWYSVCLSIGDLSLCQLYDGVHVGPSGALYITLVCLQYCLGASGTVGVPAGDGGA